MPQTPPQTDTYSTALDIFDRTHPLRVDVNENLKVAGTVIANAGTGTFLVDGSAHVQPVSGTVSISSAAATRADTYTSAMAGVTLDVHTSPVKSFGLVAVGTGNTAAHWDVVLEGSLDNSNWTTILDHTGTASQPNGYGFRRTITIDHLQVSGSNQINFPVLFSGVYPYLATIVNGGNVSNLTTLNGQMVPADLIFTLDGAGSTLLSWEVASYDATTGAIEVWVNLPSISSSADTLFFMFYGKAAVTTYQCVATLAWNTNYVMVQHLANGTTLTANDSTANGFNGTLAGVNLTAGDGQIDGGAIYGGSSNDVITIGNNAALNPTVITMSAWIKPNGNQTADGNIFAKDHNSGYRWRIISGNTIQFLDRGGTNALSGAISIPSGQWGYVVVTGSGSGLQIYVNGVLDASSAVAYGHAGSNSNLELGNDTMGPEQFIGTLDELRMENSLRSADWILTEYRNQLNPAAFYSVGAASSGTSAADGQIVWSGALLFPILYFRSRCTALTLGSASSLVTTILGT